MSHDIVQTNPPGVNIGKVYMGTTCCRCDTPLSVPIADTARTPSDVMHQISTMKPVCNDCKHLDELLIGWITPGNPMRPNENEVVLIDTYCPHSTIQNNTHITGNFGLARWKNGRWMGIYDIEDQDPEIAEDFGYPDVATTSWYRHGDKNPKLVADTWYLTRTGDQWDVMELLGDPSEYADWWEDWGTERVFPNPPEEWYELDPVRLNYKFNGETKMGWNIVHSDTTFPETGQEYMCMMQTMVDGMHMLVIRPMTSFLKQIHRRSHIPLKERILAYYDTVGTTNNNPTVANRMVNPLRATVPKFPKHLRITKKEFKMTIPSPG